VDENGDEFPGGGPNGLYRSISDKQQKEDAHSANPGHTNALARLRNNLKRFLTKHGMLSDGPQTVDVDGGTEGVVRESANSAAPRSAVGSDREVDRRVTATRVERPEKPAKFDRPQRPQEPEILNRVQRPPKPENQTDPVVQVNSRFPDSTGAPAGSAWRPCLPGYTSDRQKS